VPNSCSFRACLAEAENRVTYRCVCYPVPPPPPTLFGWLHNADHHSNDTVVYFQPYIPSDQMIMEQALRACSSKVARANQKITLQFMHAYVCVCVCVCIVRSLFSTVIITVPYENSIRRL
jgi:hypothetical protein